MKIGKIKKIVFFVVIIILLVVFGAFLWRTYGNPNPDIGLVRFEEFSIEETSAGKIIRHEDTGFEITIPVDWDIKDGGNNFYINSKDFEVDKENSSFFALLIPQKGCGFKADIEKSEEVDSIEDGYSNYQGLKDEISWCIEYPDECEQELIRIDNNLSTKYASLVDSDRIAGTHITIEIPKNENIYSFEAFLFGEDKEECSKEFDKILKTVKIK